MVTALIIANIALTLALMAMANHTKKIEKEINEINLNLALIEMKTDESKKDISKCKNAIVKEFNEIHKKALMYPSPLIFVKR